MFRAATNQVTTTRGPQKGHLQNSSKQKTGQDGRNIKELTTSLNAVQFVENVPEDEQLPGEMAENDQTCLVGEQKCRQAATTKHMTTRQVWVNCAN